MMDIQRKRLNRLRLKKAAPFGLANSDFTRSCSNCSVIRLLRYTYFMQVNRDDLAIILTQSYLFNSLDSREINKIIENSEIVFYEPGKMIFIEDSIADCCFVVVDGEIELLREKNYSLHQVNLLHASDIFGLEDDGKNPKRICSARAKNASILMRIERDLLNGFVKEHSAEKKLLAALKISYRLIIDTHQEKNKRTKNIQYFTRKHPFALYSKIASLGIIFSIIQIILIWLSAKDLIGITAFYSGFVIVIFLILPILAWLVFDWKNDIYLFSKSRVIAHKQRLILFDKRIDTPLNKITNLGVQKPLFGRMLGFGDLTVHTFTGLVKLSKIADVDLIQELLQFTIDKYRTDYGKHEDDNDESIFHSNEFDPETKGLNHASNLMGQKRNMREILGVYSRKISGANVVRLHTHWTNLIAKVLIPSLLILSHVFFVIFLAGNQSFLMNTAWFQLLMVLVGILFIGWGMYRYFDWLNDVYYITNDELIDIYRKPLGVEDRRTAPIGNIQSIRYERRGLLGLIFNFGTVYIHVGDDDFTFDNVGQPDVVQELLFSAYEQKIKDGKNLAGKNRELQITE